MKNFLRFGFFLLFAIVVACQPRSSSTLKPGDEINGMVVTTGAAKAPPLWAFCSPALENEGVLTVDCQVPSLSRLAIGHPFEGVHHALQTLDWSKLNWEFSLDGQAVDLKAFGTYDYVLPDLAPSPSSIREIFRQFKAWDVILIHPTAGAHTLSGMAQDGFETYTWTANFTVDASRAP
jgi:hypothetical protein